MNYRILIPALMMAAMTATAAAQSSEITGTLTTGTSSQTSLSGTVATTSGSGQLEGTVVSPSSGGGGGSSGSSGGGGGGGSSGGLTDMCANIAGFQTIIPYGYVQQGTTCVATGVSGGGASVPGVPNTGDGGASVPTMLYLLASGIATLLGAHMLRRRI